MKCLTKLLQIENDKSNEQKTKQKKNKQTNKQTQLACIPWTFLVPRYVVFLYIKERTKIKCTLRFPSKHTCVSIVAMTSKNITDKNIISCESLLCKLGYYFSNHLCSPTHFRQQTSLLSINGNLYINPHCSYPRLCRFFTLGYLHPQKRHAKVHI